MACPTQIPTKHRTAGTHTFQSRKTPGTNNSVKSNGIGKIGLAKTIARTIEMIESTSGKKELVGVSFRSGAFKPWFCTRVTIPTLRPAATIHHPANKVVATPPNTAYHSSTKKGFENTAPKTEIIELVTSKTELSKNVHVFSSEKSGVHTEARRKDPATHAHWLQSDCSSTTSSCRSA